MCNSIADEAVCLGDFNIDFFKSLSSATIYFSDRLESLGWSQIVSTPMRVGINNFSLIDLIVTSNASIIESCEVSHVDFSDHDFVYCMLKVNRVNAESKFYTYRDYKHLNEEQFLNDLKSLPLDVIYYMTNIDSKIKFFNSCLLHVFDFHASIRTAFGTVGNR